MESGRRFCGGCGAETPDNGAAEADPGPSQQAAVEPPPSFSDATKPFALSILRGGQPVRQARDSRPPLKLVGLGRADARVERNEPRAADAGRAEPRRTEPRREGALALAQEHETSPAETTGEIARAEVLRLRPQSSESNRAPDAPKPPVRPPVLASEALLEDIEPTEPAARLSRVAAVVLGLGGAAGALAADHSIHGAAVAAAMAAAGGIALAPMRYGVRGIAAAVVSAIGLALAARTRLAFGAPIDTAFLSFVCSLLAGGLLVRGYYRASKVARLLVGGGVILGATWFIGSGAITGMTALHLDWQSWMPALLRGGFILTLLLSLLAFMEPTTGAGCRLWGVGVIVWHAVYVATELAVRAMPVGGRLGHLLFGSTSVSGQEVAASVASVCLTATASLGMLAAIVALIARPRDEAQPTSE